MDLTPAPWQRLRTPASREPVAVANWIEHDFVKWFVREADPSHWPNEDDQGAFAITLLCLVHCTAAAGLVNGISDANSRQCVEFIQAYFASAPEPSGARYAGPRAAVLYTLFRHGLAHQRVPGRLDLERNGETIGWVLDRHGERPNHLHFHRPGLYNVQAHRYDDWFRLRVQPDLLFEDCLHAFRKMQEKVANDAELAGKIYDGSEKAIEPRLVPGAAILEQLRQAVDRADGAPPDPAE